MSVIHSCHVMSSEIPLQLDIWLRHTLRHTRQREHHAQWQPFWTP